MKIQLNSGFIVQRNVKFHLQPAPLICSSSLRGSHDPMAELSRAEGEPMFLVAYSGPLWERHGRSSKEVKYRHTAG